MDNNLVDYKKILLIIAIFITFTVKLNACTLLLVSGKATKDGRPLLMKVRDSTSGNNVFINNIEGKDFSYVAQYTLTNSVITGPWGGCHEKSFAIVNSLSYNIPDSNTGELNDDIIEMALESCQTLEEFEILLDHMEKPAKVRANYGVIDANGGAAFYEVGCNGYTKYDANDLNTTPDGILVRTNFSLSGDMSNKSGEDRYLAATLFTEEAKGQGKINWLQVIREFPRFLKNGNNQNLINSVVPTKGENKVYYDGYIPRFNTTNAMLFQGALPEELPSMMVAWMMNGHPFTTVAVPIMGFVNHLPSKTMIFDNRMESWLCKQSRRLLEEIFCYEGSEFRNHINLECLYNLEENGILQKIKRIEDVIFDKGCTIIENARMNGSYSENQIVDYYDWLDSYLFEEYSRCFPELMLTGILSSVGDKGLLRYWDLMGRQFKFPIKGILIDSNHKKKVFHK